MSFLALVADERVLNVEFNDDALSVSLRDGRVISVPLVWYPRLLNATTAQRKNWKIAGGGYGIHWPDLDEDLSTEGLLRGAPAPKAQLPQNSADASNKVGTPSWSSILRQDGDFDFGQSFAKGGNHEPIRNRGCSGAKNCIGSIVPALAKNVPSHKRKNGYQPYMRSFA